MEKMSRDSNRIFFHIFVIVTLVVIAGYLKFNLRRNKYISAVEKYDYRYSSLVETFIKAKEGDLKYFQSYDPLYGKPLINRYGMNVIHYAVENSHYDLIKLFIEKKYNFNTQNFNKEYPLEISIRKCDIKMIQLLTPVTKNEILKQLSAELNNCIKGEKHAL